MPQVYRSHFLLVHPGIGIGLPQSDNLRLDNEDVNHHSRQKFGYPADCARPDRPGECMKWYGWMGIYGPLVTPSRRLLWPISIHPPSQYSHM